MVGDGLPRPLRNDSMEAIRPPPLEGLSVICEVLSPAVPVRLTAVVERELTCIAPLMDNPASPLTEAAADAVRLSEVTRLLRGTHWPRATARARTGMDPELK